jgi:thiamine kinase-like enzyme
VHYNGGMNVQKAILEAIQNIPEYGYPGEWRLAHLQENAYHLSGPAGAYFVKWISDDDAYGQNEIRINQEVLAHTDLPTPRLLQLIPAEQATIVCWEWLEGTDLRRQFRELLPQAFNSLGRFHAIQQHMGTVISPTTLRAFSTIGELLEAELAFLCRDFVPAIHSACKPYFELLRDSGYPTLIHGDMHPGNLRLTSRGLLFVDWGFALPSLNLFDLDYIQSVELEPEAEKNWWDITPVEAESILPAYFQSSGSGAVDMRAVHRAVMVWNQLGSSYNALSNGNETGARRCRQNLERLLSFPDNRAGVAASAALSWFRSSCKSM